MKHSAILLVLLLAVLVSCGKKSTAKDTVEAFLTENLATEAPTGLTIERLDSTNNLVDTTITLLHRNAELSGLYKKGVSYAARPQKQKLVWVIATFETGCKARKQTFYLNRECDKVIAVKF